MVFEKVQVFCLRPSWPSLLNTKLSLGQQHQWQRRAQTGRTEEFKQKQEEWLKIKLSISLIKSLIIIGLITIYQLNLNTKSRTCTRSRSITRYIFSYMPFVALLVGFLTSLMVALWVEQRPRFFTSTGAIILIDSGFFRTQRFSPCPPIIPSVKYTWMKK